MTDTPAAGVKATQTSLDVLKEIKVRNGATLSEIVDALSLARSTVHSHLRTLIENGYVVREGSTYKLGLYLLHMGVQARNRSPHFRVAKEHVDRLAGETDLEVDFTVEENGREITLYDATGGTETSDIQVGSCFPLHNNASGKAILAELSPDRIDSIIDRWGLPATTERTITDRESLLAEIEQVRNQGYAFNEQELLDGYSAIGMTATFPNGDRYGALAIGGPAYRIEYEEDQLVDRLASTVEDVEAGLADETGHMDPNWWKQIWDCDKVTADQDSGSTD